MRWQLKDDQDNLIAEIAQTPYYNTGVTSDWRSGTLANDAVELGLPADLPTGRYRLYVQVETPSHPGELQYVGPVELKQVGPRVQSGPEHVTSARFGSGMFLAA